MATTNAYLTTRDGSGNPLAGVKMYFQLLAVPPGVDEWSEQQFTGTSDSTGFLSVQMLQLATYRMRCEQGEWSDSFTTTATLGFQLPQFFGPE